MINLFQPSLGNEELEAVRRVFESNWIGKGSMTDEFESRFAEHQGVDRRLMRSVSCCTEGLFQAIELLQIGEGDEVVLPTISFVGAANAIAARGATPVFCDVDSRTLNPTAAMIDEKVSERTKAIMVLHYGGVPCQIDEICQLADQRRIALIEDSAASVTSRFRGKACGTFGTIGTWSFDAMKILVTGDGGMVYCKSEEMIDRFEKQVYLGLEQGSGYSNQNTSTWWEFEISSVGRRAIINDIASAIGVEQLKKLSGYIERRREIHQAYDDALREHDWLQTPPPIPEHSESSYYFYWIQVQPGLRDPLAMYLREQNVYTSFRYYPLHWVKGYGQNVHLPNAESAASTTLCLPIHQSLTDEEVQKVIDCVGSFAENARSGALRGVQS